MTAEQVILAVEECDLTQPMCVPSNTNDLFILPNIFGQVNRTILLMFLAALIVVALLYVAFRKPKLVPTKFQAAMEGLVGFVRDEIAIGIIGPEGIRYFPYLLSLFLFILVGSLFEITPLINFPITSRMAIPAFLALVTYFIFVIVGFARHGFSYLGGIVWPSSIPIYARVLVGPIEFVSVFLIRPISLAVRLFANLVAGHVMLSLLLVSGVVFIGAAFTGDVSILKGGAGVLWFAFGMGFLAFEIFVAVIQAYIFTLLSAVYIQTSLHPEH